MKINKKIVNLFTAITTNKGDHCGSQNITKLFELFVLVCYSYSFNQVHKWDFVSVSIK